MSESLMEIMQEIKETHKKLQAISPNHALLDYVGMDERGVQFFSNTESSQRFVERFCPNLEGFSWETPFQEYQEALSLGSFMNYLSALKRAVKAFQ